MSKLLPPSKLLPATILATVAALAFKTASLVIMVPGPGAFRDGTSQALDAASSASVIGHAEAASPQAASIPQSSSPAAKAPAAPAAPSVQSAPPAPAEAQSAPVAPVEAASDATEEINLRRSRIEEREQRLTEREGSLAAEDKHLTDRVGELLAIKSRLETLESERKEHNEANWAGLVKLYETMKPRDAAVIFNTLDKPVLLEILDRMKPAKASPVVALMAPDSARQVTADLAAKRNHSTTLSN